MDLTHDKAIALTRRSKIISAVADFLNDPARAWPEESRFHRRNREKAERARSALTADGTSLEKALKSLADGLVVQIVTRGGSGSHFAGDVISEAIGGINAHEVYPPEAFLDGCSNDDLRRFNHVLLRAHAKQFAVNDIGSRPVVITSHQGSTFEPPENDPTHPVITLLRDPFDAAISRAFRKDAYRAEVGDSGDDLAWLRSQASQISAFMKWVESSSFPRLNYERLVARDADHLDDVLQETKISVVRDLRDVLDELAKSEARSTSNFNPAPRRETSGLELELLNEVLGETRLKHGYPAGEGTDKVQPNVGESHWPSILPWAAGPLLARLREGNFASYEGDRVHLALHSKHPPLDLDVSQPILPQLEGVDNTVQLYLHGLSWTAGIDWSDPTAARLVMSLVRRLIAEISASPKDGAWNMPWDDHAVADRAGSLCRLEAAGLLTSNEVDRHLHGLEHELEALLTDPRWNRSNHRIFHLYALLELLLRRGATSRRIGEVRTQLVYLLEELVDEATGFAREESVAYSLFDAELVERAENGLAEIDLLDRPVRSLTGQLHNSLAALAWPDGMLPASGDTNLNFPLPSGRTPTTTGHLRVEEGELRRRNERLESLDAVGWHRLVSPNGTAHAVMLSHLGEGAHGHVSPLHVDVWFENIGLILCDPGGPYRYGDPLRYSWFKAAAGHTTLDFDNRPQNVRQTVEVQPHGLRDRAVGSWTLWETNLRRSICMQDDRVLIDETVTRGGNWTLAYQFAPGWVMKDRIPKLGISSQFKLEHLDGNLIDIAIIRCKGGGVSVDLSMTPRCLSVTDVVDAPTLRLAGAGTVELRVEIGVSKPSHP